MRDRWVLSRAGRRAMWSVTIPGCRCVQGPDSQKLVGHIQVFHFSPLEKQGAIKEFKQEDDLVRFYFQKYHTVI